MAKMKCPHCGAEVKLDNQSRGNFFDDVSARVTCSHCGKNFNLPAKVREKLQAASDIDDLATLDFLSDDEIDGHIF